MYSKLTSEKDELNVLDKDVERLKDELESREKHYRSSWNPTDLRSPPTFLQVLNSPITLWVIILLRSIAIGVFLSRAMPFEQAPICCAYFIHSAPQVF